MKKVVVTVLAFTILLGVTSLAQTKKSNGLKAGVSIANFSGSDVSATNDKTGLSAGVFWGIDVSNQIRIQPELLYTMRGAKGDTAGITGQINLDYIEVPVLIKWMLPTKGTVDPSLFAGLAPALNIRAKAKGLSGGLTGEIDIKDEVKDVDFSAVFGGGFDFAAGNGNFGFDVRYAMGLSSIDDTGFDLDVKNEAWTVMLAYTIPMGQ